MDSHNAFIKCVSLSYSSAINPEPYYLFIRTTVTFIKFVIVYKSIQHNLFYLFKGEVHPCKKKKSLVEQTSMI